MAERTARKMRGKTTLIMAVVIVGGLALLASVQTWVHVGFFPGVAAVEGIEVSGQKASPSLTLTSLAALASALVLTIAGKMFRRVIGVLIFLLGAGLALVGTVIALDPFSGARSQVEEVTGISGNDTQYALVSEISVTIWPAVTAVLGVLLALAGVLIVVFGGRWKSAGRKYDTGGGTPPRVRAAAEGDRISEWDALSDGDDPTDT